VHHPSGFGLEQPTEKDRNEAGDLGSSASNSFDWLTAESELAALPNEVSVDSVIRELISRSVNPPEMQAVHTRWEPGSIA
jgi:hypothetical protein